MHVKPGESLNVGKPLFDVDVDAQKPAGSGSAPKAAEKKEESKPQAQTQSAPTPAKEAPKAESPKSTPPPKSDAPKAPQPTISSTSTQRIETREPMSRLRQRVAQRLK